MKTSETPARNRISFAAVAAWICFVSAFVLPLSCRWLALSHSRPSNRQSASHLLFLFVLAQLVAILLGIASFFGKKKGHGDVIVIMSAVGIVIGLAGGALSFFYAALAGIGP